MKNAIIGSLVGIAVVIALDSILRVVLAVYSGISIPMISYEEFDFMWALILTIFAGFSAFLGGLFSLNFGKTHKVMTVILFAALLILMRYIEIHLLYPHETLFYPVTALILSLAGLFLAWQIMAGKGKSKEPKDQYHHYPGSDQDTEEGN
jgi:hypothetical protein